MHPHAVDGGAGARLRHGQMIAIGVVYPAHRRFAAPGERHDDREARRPVGEVMGPVQGIDDPAPVGVIDLAQSFGAVLMGFLADDQGAGDQGSKAGCQEGL